MTTKTTVNNNYQSKHMLTLCVHLHLCMSASLCRVLVMDHRDSLLTRLTLVDKSPVCWQAQRSAGTTAREEGHFLWTSCSTQSMNAKNRKVCFHSGMIIQKYYTNKNIYCSFTASLVSPQCLFQKVGLLVEGNPRMHSNMIYFFNKNKQKILTKNVIFNLINLKLNLI